jgi:hypothetical protein
MAGPTASTPGDGWGAAVGGDISKKLHLHARSLTIEHPITKEMMTFTAPLPDHMARTWKALDWKEDDVPADPFDGVQVSAGWTAKRFWTAATAEPAGGGFAVRLDGRPVKTPAKAPWWCRPKPWPGPSPPNGMRRTGPCPARDHALHPRRQFRHRQGRAAAGRGDRRTGRLWRQRPDVLPRRGAPALVARQAAAWDPLLDWARDTLAAPLRVTAGVIPVPQPAESLARLTDRVAGLTISSWPACTIWSPSRARWCWRWPWPRAG